MDFLTYISEEPTPLPNCSWMWNPNLCIKRRGHLRVAAWNQSSFSEHKGRVKDFSDMQKESSEFSLIYYDKPPEDPTLLVLTYLMGIGIPATRYVVWVDNTLSTEIIEENYLQWNVTVIGKLLRYETFPHLFDKYYRKSSHEFLTSSFLSS